MDNERKIKISNVNIKNNITIDFENKVKINNRYYLNVQCLNCSNSSLCRLDQISKGSFSCRACIRKRWVESVEKISDKFTIVDDSNSNSIQIHCSNCDNVFGVQSGHLSAFKCKGCIEKAYKDALRKRDCKYISRYTKKSSGDTLYIVYENILGETFEVQSGHLLSGNWLEFKPKEAETIKLYIMEFFSKEESMWYFKIGVSINPEYRLKSLKLTESVIVKEIRSFSSRKDCLEFETNVHKKLKNFKADENVVKSFSKKIKMRNGEQKHDGVSEWFCSKSKELFQKEFLNAISIEN